MHTQVNIISALLLMSVVNGCDAAEPLQALDDLTHSDAQTVGVMNSRSDRSGLLYRSPSACYVRQYGSVHEDQPRVEVACPAAMLQAPWQRCTDGEIFRNRDGTCLCYEMSQPNAQRPRALSSRPSACPAPALAADSLAQLPDGQPGVLNPHSTLYGRIYRDRDGTCMVNGPLEPGLATPSGSWIVTRPFPCPPGMFEGCARGIVQRLPDQSCTCTDVEGDPPAERPVAFPCPPPAP